MFTKRKIRSLKYQQYPYIASQINKERKKTQINNMSDERGVITTDPTYI